VDPYKLIEKSVWLPVRADVNIRFHLDRVDTVESPLSTQILKA
jgi:hypothetical protein